MSKTKTPSFTTKIVLLVFITLVFYVVGFLGEKSSLVYSGHITALFTIIYGYIKLFSTRSSGSSSLGSKAFGILDIVITLGFAYIFFDIAWVESIPTKENAFFIIAMLMIIVGKFIHYYKKEFSGELAEG